MCLIRRQGDLCSSQDVDVKFTSRDGSVLLFLTSLPSPHDLSIENISIGVDLSLRGIKFLAEVIGVIPSFCVSAENSLVTFDGCRSRLLMIV